MQGDKDRWEQFIRNGRWGTCGDCPRDGDGKAYPEMCKYDTRSDHHLTIDDLFKQYNRFMDM